MNYKEYSILFRPEVEKSLQESIELAVPDSCQELKNMMRYHLGWDGEGSGEKAQGKRIRPMLVLLCAESAGGNWKNALSFASAVELIHNFSLLHDDIQDQSDFRRGRPAVWKIWGEAQAINAGDSMYSIAYQTIIKNKPNMEEEKVLSGVNLINQACINLTKGQFLDISFEKQEGVEIDTYLTMIHGKTASLLACSTQLGAVAAGVNNEKMQGFYDFGLNLGLAFQIVDDILGLWGDEAKTGKSTATDLISRKKTFPIMYGLKHNQEFQQYWSNNKIDQSNAQKLSSLLKNDGTYEVTKEKAAYYTNKALNSLEKAAVNEKPAKALKELSRILIERDY